MFVYHVDAIWRTICIIIVGNVGAAVAAAAATVTNIVVVVVVMVNAIIVVRVIGDDVIRIIGIVYAIRIKTSKEIVTKVALLFNVIVRWKFTLQAIVCFRHEISVIWCKITFTVSPYRFRI